MYMHFPPSGYFSEYFSTFFSTFFSTNFSTFFSTYFSTYFTTFFSTYFSSYFSTYFPPSTWCYLIVFIWRGTFWIKDTHVYIIEVIQKCFFVSKKEWLSRGGSVKLEISHSKQIQILTKTSKRKSLYMLTEHNLKPFCGRWTHIWPKTHSMRFFWCLHSIKKIHPDYRPNPVRIPSDLKKIIIKNWIIRTGYLKIWFGSGCARPGLEIGFRFASLFSTSVFFCWSYSFFGDFIQICSI